MKSNAEFSDYQKKIEAMDNVILCVAEAERMVQEIGRSLVSEITFAATSGPAPSKSGKFSWGVYRPRR
jgi:hypothetical protein